QRAPHPDVPAGPWFEGAFGARTPLFEHFPNEDWTDMKYVRMGTTGAQVSRLCLGCMSFGGMADWMLSEEASLPIIQKAYEAGINFFDTADVYSRGQS